MKLLYFCLPPFEWQNCSLITNFHRKNLTDHNLICLHNQIISIFADTARRVPANFLYCFSQLSVRLRLFFHSKNKLYSVVNEHFFSARYPIRMLNRYILVGPSRLELPTSRLSGARSNHLSYEPVLGSILVCAYVLTCPGVWWR